MVGSTGYQRCVAYLLSATLLRRRRRSTPHPELLEVREPLTYTVTANLGELLPAGAAYASLVAEVVIIDAASDAAGTIDSSSGDPSEAFLQNNNGTLTNLPPILNEPKSVAAGINNSGQVVGDSLTIGGGIGGSTLNEQPILYTQGTPEQLGTLGGNVSTATGINESGEVVGSSEAAATGSLRACLIRGTIGL